MTTDIVVRRKDEVGHLFAALQSMQASLRAIAQRIRGSAQAIGAASSALARGNSHLARRTEAQASTLEQTAASMEQFLASVQNNARSAARADEFTRRASELGKTGGEQMRELKLAMQQASGSATRIQEITGVINAIAFQTNILALNAAVEAARAGEQGRGFTVVAQEVRILAQRCAEASKQIDALVSESAANVQAGVAKLDAVVGTLDALLDGVQRSTEAVGEIAHATREQRTGVEQVSEGVTQLDRVTQQNATLVEDAARGAKRLDELAQELLDAANNFTVSAHEHGGAARPQIRTLPQVEAPRASEAERYLPAA